MTGTRRSERVRPALCPHCITDAVRRWVVLRWVGLLMAIGGGLTAIIAGKGQDWFTAIIGGLIFVIGMAALSNRGSG